MKQTRDSDADLNWQSLIAYDAYKERFKSLVVKGRFPPVMLLHGREGIGKRIFSAYVSSLFFCETQQACGQCSSCIRIMNNRHSNVLRVHKGVENSIKLSKLQNLEEFLSVSISRENKQLFRILVIIDADKLTIQSANVLLKTLEQNPTNTFVILTSSQKKAIPKTLLSRCVMWQVRPPMETEIVNYLETQKKLSFKNFSKEDISYFFLQNGFSLRAILEKIEEIGLEKLMERKKNDLFIDSSFELNDLIASYQSKDFLTEDFIRYIELSFNAYYKKILSANTRRISIFLRERRNFIHRVKKIALKQKIKINQGLLSETLYISDKDLFSF